MGCISKPYFRCRIQCKLKIHLPIHPRFPVPDCLIFHDSVFLPPIYMDISLSRFEAANKNHSRTRDLVSDLKDFLETNLETSND